MNTYQEREIGRLSKLAIESWPEQRRRRHPYILPAAIANENLLAGVRASALDYFAEHDIRWWLSDREKAERETLENAASGPTGHMNSSQVACVNHLEPVRLDESVALAVARRLEPRVASVRDTGEGGYVSFEWIGDKSYLNERGPRTRGEKITSLDAVMPVALDDGTPALIAIEWKYTEAYEKGREMRFAQDGTDRVERYRNLIEAEGTPLLAGPPERFFYEPYEQLMRQTLLAAAVAADPDAPEQTWVHVHVIPRNNLELRTRVKHAAPLLTGETLEETWRSALTAPERYRVVTPSDVVPVDLPPSWDGWRRQLSDRYLT